MNAFLSIYIRDNSRISRLCADGAQSKFVCAIFERCAPYVTESVYYTCTGYMHQITTDFTSVSCLSIKY